MCQRLFSWTPHCQRVLLARDSLVRLGGSLCLGDAVFQISVLSGSCWHTAISICCNDSRHCHAKDVILILRAAVTVSARHSRHSYSLNTDCMHPLEADAAMRYRNLRLTLTLTWLYRPRCVIKVVLECMCLIISTSTYSSRFFLTYFLLSRK